MPQVFIVNYNAGHDYSTAKRHGDLVRLTEGDVNIFATDRLLTRLNQALRGATPDDCLLLSGNVVLNSLAVALWIRRFPQIRLLIYDSRDKRYRRRELKADAFAPEPDEETPTRKET